MACPSYSASTSRLRRNVVMMMINNPFVSILMLTHNAPEYVAITLESVAKYTHGVDYEVVVVDNASDAETVDLLKEMHAAGRIDKLHFSPVNTLFAGGNNIASTLANTEATHFLLLNSDVEVRDEDWLNNLLEHHREGATAYGIARDPLRIDGYCLLIDAGLYKTHPLDEGHQWWWSVTKQQATLLRLGYTVAGFYEHERYVHHFGGRSGSAFKSARGMDVTRREVARWFGHRRPVVLDGLPRRTMRQVFSRRVSPYLRAAWRLLQRRVRRSNP